MIGFRHGIWVLEAVFFWSYRHRDGIFFGLYISAPLVGDVLVDDADPCVGSEGGEEKGAREGERSKGRREERGKGGRGCCKEGGREKERSKGGREKERGEEQGRRGWKGKLIKVLGWGQRGSQDEPTSLLFSVFWISIYCRTYGGWEEGGVLWE
jgi:hypothetical protein